MAPGKLDPKLTWNPANCCLGKNFEPRVKPAGLDALDYQTLTSQLSRVANILVSQAVHVRDTQDVNTCGYPNSKGFGTPVESTISAPH